MASQEVVVAQFDDLQDGEMKQVSAGETEILLTRIDGSYHAVGAHCRHYGAPLAKGFLNGSRVVCPWHQACYDVITGKVSEPPALDDIARYEVKQNGSDIVVVLPQAEEEAEKVGRDPSADERTFVVLGGGAAGAAAVITLRRNGFQGRLLMISKDDRFPYDRPNLSKAYMAGEAPEDWMPLREDDFYERHDIEAMCNQVVERVHVPSRTLYFAGGEELQADAILLATGGIPKRLKVPGAELRNVFTLRTFADCDTILEAARNAGNAVIVGASFIGMEVAASLRERGLDVTVVAPENVPFEKVFGEKVGRLVRSKHEEHGVRFRLGQNVERFEGEETVKRVVLKSGETVEADLVVIGVGVRPATDMLDGIQLKDDGSVSVDQYLKLADGVFAAGDITTFPDPRTGEPNRIEHWRLAEQHGRIAALNMLGNRIPFKSTPFFWTRHFGSSIQYVGHATRWDEIIYHGDPMEGKFLAYYVQDGAILAVSALGHGKETGAVSELMRLGQMPSPNDVRRGSPEMFAERIRSHAVKERVAAQ